MDSKTDLPIKNSSRVLKRLDLFENINYRSTLTYGFLALTFLLGTIAGSYKTVKYFTEYYIYLVYAVIISSAIYFKVKDDLTGYLKLVLFTILIADYVNHYLIIILTVILFYKEILWSNSGYFKIYAVLFLWAVISYILSLFREPNFLALPLYFLTFFAPVLFFNLAYRIKDKKIFTEAYNFYLNLLVIIISISTLFTIYFWNTSPDVRTGGTVSTHSTAVFLILASTIIFSKHQAALLTNKTPIKEKVIFLITPFMIYFLDAKYILGCLLISLLLTFLIVYKNYRIKIAVFALVLLIITGWYNFTDQAFNLSQWTAKKGAFTLKGIENTFTESAKGKLVNFAMVQPANHPVLFLTGYGPGTFLSFAGNARNYRGIEFSYINLGGRFVLVNDLFRKFLPEYKSKLKENFTGVFKNKYMNVSSIFDWRSSFLAIYFELGITGLFIFISSFIYILVKGMKIVKSKNAGQIGIVLISLSFFFFLMSFNELWFEFAHFVIIINLLLGALFNFADKNKSLAIV